MDAFAVFPTGMACSGVNFELLYKIKYFLLKLMNQII